MYKRTAESLLFLLKSESFLYVTMLQYRKKLFNGKLLVKDSPEHFVPTLKKKKKKESKLFVSRNFKMYEFPV